MYVKQNDPITYNADNTKTLKISSSLKEAWDIIRMEGIKIDEIINGHKSYWDEFDVSNEHLLKFQKRVYIVTLRHLPKIKYKDLFLKLTNEYQENARGNVDLLKEHKLRQKLEDQDISVFEEWLKNGNIMSEKELIPIDEEYRKHMTPFYPLGTGITTVEKRENEGKKD